MSITGNLGILDVRAKEITGEYARRIRKPYQDGKLSDSGSIEIIMGMDLSDVERTWLAYHVGTINQAIRSAKEGHKDVTIIWGA